MTLTQKIQEVQKSLKDLGVDGWLMYDFRRTNDLACDFLEIPKETLLTRRFFYWIPNQGDPVKLVSAIETKILESLPGLLRPYRTWKEMENILGELLKGRKKIAMEYSPRNAVPYLSKVDAGTMEVIKEFGVVVVSSADLLQQYTSIWDQEKWHLHLQAEQVVTRTVEQAWDYISENLKGSNTITEYDVQQRIIEEFSKQRCITAGDPICAVNENSADPHYTPSKNKHKKISRGDFILIDLWCKKDLPKATYADITRVGVADTRPTEKQQQIFDIVRKSRDTAVELIKRKMASGEPLLGWEVDQASRKIIEEAGLGRYFIHRTGHNIDESDHGSGAHIDNFETQEKRQILPGTCFSIEPGIYIPGEFGIRLEFNVFIHQNRKVQITGGIQEKIHCCLL
jgi:Xaa-Pro dipeptidase